MKSTDKFVLVLVASLALLLAGCGGGSSTTAPPVDPGPTAAEQAIMDAKAALTTAQAGMSSAMTDAEMLAAYRAVQSAADNLVMVLKANGGSLDDVEMAAATRQDAMTMADNLAMKIADAQAAADKAMMAMAAKLYDAIGMTPLGTATAARSVGSDADGILTITDGSVNSGALEVDKMAMVASLHGWEGSEQTGKVAAAAGVTNAGTYTARLYSNVGEPTQGNKFGSATSGAAGYVYTDLNATTGERSIDTSTPAVQELVASSSFDQSAGTKEFELGTNLQRVIIAGSFHGVSGTYYCTPAASSTCAVQIAADGFTLGGTADADNAFTTGGGAWTFKPTDPETRVMGTPDSVYAIYGWWLHEATDGTATVSAFTSYREPSANSEAASGITALQGSATYKGGAAGKYTVRAGAVNDAGHFTADAELMADFSKNTVTGTIDNFMGGDGMSRDWSVALGASTVADTGGIAGDPDTAGDTAVQQTTWTMGGSAGNADGQWSGTLYQNNDGGVPSVGTGTFHSEYGNIGRMVGAFGVNLEN